LQERGPEIIGVVYRTNELALKHIHRVKIGNGVEHQYQFQVSITSISIVTVEEYRLGVFVRK
jgi:hypothetical protein